ncbi:FAD-dependent oxidoreductase [Rhodococcus sp. Eu-32]|uniref:FAD-dependent oxidoreductase n=1 Tax=Rhodococcus sp. Eu-32 TaxID=1017319 RepID=UPI000DF2F9DD|nr:FAD-dependent oxidoreductase [Rhodococcus sp. Eu-32]RRQ29380.1 FAD-dependent oxidoreductase [Rhodococcus sp. Eu-32]
MKVVVVGGGVIGTASAWILARRGHQVTLLEQFEPGHKNGASHGSSRIFRHAYADDFYVSLASRAHTLWRELENSTGTELLTLTGAVDHGLPATVSPRADALARAGLAAEVLHPHEARRRWPGLAFDTTVLHHPDAGRLDADGSVDAFVVAARNAGAAVHYGSPVREITASDVSTNSRTYKADHVVVAAGAWSSKVLGSRVDLPTLVTTQEQPAHFLPTVDADWPSFIHHPGAELRTEGIYGLQGVEGIKIGEHGTGPVVDPDDRDFTPGLEGIERLKAYARSWLPGVDADSADALTCLYTTTPDSNFVVDRVGHLTVAAGFSGHGFKFAPAIGELVADLVDGGSTPELFRLGVRYGGDVS